MTDKAGMYNISSIILATALVDFRQKERERHGSHWNSLNHPYSPFSMEGITGIYIQLSIFPFPSPLLSSLRHSIYHRLKSCLTVAVCLYGAKISFSFLSRLLCLVLALFFLFI